MYTGICYKISPENRGMAERYINPSRHPCMVALPRLLGLACSDVPVTMLVFFSEICPRLVLAFSATICCSILSLDRPKEIFWNPLHNLLVVQTFSSDPFQLPK
jgi:hypothetical protein